MGTLGRRQFDGRIGHNLEAAVLPMPKPKRASVLYRLIEAGQRAHLAVGLPLLELGLEPGDDALLFLLADRGGITEADLSTAFGRDPAALAPRIYRLAAQELILRRAIGPELELGIALTDAGAAVHAALVHNWTEVQDLLLADFTPRQRKAFRRALKGVTKQLRNALAERSRTDPPVDEGDGGNDHERENDEPG